MTQENSAIQSAEGLALQAMEELLTAYRLIAARDARYHGVVFLLENMRAEGARILAEGRAN